MKRIIFITAFIITNIILAAQPPQGERPRQGQANDRNGRRPPMRGQMGNMQVERTDDYWILNFPEIPNLSQDNKRKIIDLLIKEKKEIDKLIREKMDLEDKVFNLGDQSKKEIDKLNKKIEKTDSNIRKTADNYNKKYSKILTSEQLSIFKEKRREIKFIKPRSGPNKQGPDDENRPMGPPDGDMPPPPPGGMPMFGRGPGW